MSDFEVTAPVYPLSREEFRRALTTGHGRALIHAEEFDGFTFRDDILNAASQCLGYDTQVEGYRESWLARLCAAGRLIDTVILQEPGESDHDRTQRARLLGEFHRMGHAGALPGLYEMCRRRPGTNEVDAVDELIEADGENGLLFAARQLGGALADDPDFWLGGWELSDYDRLHGEGSTLRILDEAAHGDPFIALCLTRWNEVTTPQDSPREPEERKSVDEVVQEVMASKKRQLWLRRWGKLASAEDREKIAGLLSDQSNPLILENALICLAATGLPVFDKLRLGLAFHESDNVRFHATSVFSHHHEPEVRQAGLALLAKGEPADGVRLMRSSAEPCDAVAIRNTLAQGDPENDIHSLCCGIVEMMEHNHRIRDPQLALSVYEVSPCMHCRFNALRCLLEWQACPDWVLLEAEYDGSEGIRDLVKDRK